MNSKTFCCRVCWCLAFCTSAALAQYDANAPEPIGKLRGAVVLHGGGEVSEKVVDRFMQLAAGKEARIVVIPTASADVEHDDVQQDVEIFKMRSPANVTVLHARTRAEAETPEFSEPLKTATGVWFMGGQQSRIGATYAGTPVEKELQELIARGGVVGGTGAGAAALSKQMIASGEEHAALAAGLDIVPGAIIDQHFLTRQRQPRLMDALKSHPGLVGLGVDEGTALVLRGRSLSVIGESSATLCIAASKTRPERIERLTAGKTADLIALSRSAVARTLPAFPLAEPPEPVVPAGTLIIVGGGGMPKGLLERFVELAGGAEAEIVYLPCTEAEEVPGEQRFVDSIRKLGVKKATLLHTKDRTKANRDEAFLAPLKSATGVFFGGGRQWNLVDSYQNTTAHKLIQDVLARGGVIAGSSAGASIQGDYMPRGDPLGNLNIIAEGYERGLGLLCGVAIDQHFTQRKRLPDMTLLMKTYPQLLGIGLDESTAIVVQKSTAEVVGLNHVHFYDYKHPPLDSDKDYLMLSAGQRYDLKARKVVEP